MKIWQVWWLRVIAAIAILHLIRDILQDTGIQTILSTSFVKHPSSWYPKWYWYLFNTYAFSVTELGLVLYCFKNKSFGRAGFISMIVAVTIFIAWLVYWFFL